MTAQAVAVTAYNTAQLEAENARLRDRASVLERRCGHLMADADRREERARKAAEDCAEHGKEIQHLRHLASWCWAAEQHADSQRRAVVAAIGNASLALRGRTEPVPASEVTAFLDRITAAQKKVRKGHPGYPTLADCLRGGGCDHDGLSGALVAEIAQVLGIAAARTAAAA